jgi:hypothetical protein
LEVPQGEPLEIPNSMREGSAHCGEVQCGGYPHPPSVQPVRVVGEIRSGTEKWTRDDPRVCWLGFVPLSAKLELAGHRQQC